MSNVEQTNLAPPVAESPDSHTMSRSPTVASEATHEVPLNDNTDPSATLTDLHGQQPGKKGQTTTDGFQGGEQPTVIASTLGDIPVKKGHKHANALSSLSPSKKNFLTLVFCIAMVSENGSFSNGGS